MAIRSSAMAHLPRYYTLDLPLSGSDDFPIPADELREDDHVRPSQFATSASGGNH
jgi:hypothetical protein